MVHAMRTFAVAVAAGTTVVSGLSSTAVAQTSSAGRSAAAVSCIGTSFSGTMGTNQAICNSGYYVLLQDNGDLVLRRSNGSACYASGTRAPGDASATFVMNVAGVPYVDINSTSQGRVGRILGAHTGGHFGTNASVNSRGEFWIGYKKIGYC